MSALSILVAACVVVIASEDFYRDEHQHIYTIGLYGERVYESDEGKPNQKKKDKISFHKYQDFAEFGWKLFKVNALLVICQPFLNSYFSSR